MKKIIGLLASASISLAACSDGAPENSAINIVEKMEPVGSDGAVPANQFGFWEAPQRSIGSELFETGGPSAKEVAQSASNNIETPRTGEGSDTASPDTAGAAQIAYSYAFGFSIEQESIPTLQAAHTNLCDSMGPRCRVLRMSQAGTDGFDGYGELRLQVEAGQAREFGDALRKPAEELGGEQASFLVDGEDLGETIIDTEAKLRSRVILRDKLTSILRSNRGSVDELVKAERAVAEVNEEIDANRSKLADLRGRIRFSAITIEYNPYLGQTSTGFAQPVWVALTSIGSTLGMTISLLIYLVTALVPVTALILGLRWLLHRFGVRIRFWRKSPQDSTA